MLSERRCPLRYTKSIRNLQSETRPQPSAIIQNPKSRIQNLPEEFLPIDAEFITLGQFLKAVNVIGTGGEAKFYLAENVAQVNGEPEQRRGRKLRPGDLIIAPGAAPTRLTANEGVGVRVSGVEDTGDAIQSPKSKIQNGNVQNEADDDV